MYVYIYLLIFLYIYICIFSPGDSPPKSPEIDLTIHDVWQSVCGHVADNSAYLFRLTKSNLKARNLECSGRFYNSTTLPWRPFADNN